MLSFTIFGKHGGRGVRGGVGGGGGSLGSTKLLLMGCSKSIGGVLKGPTQDATTGQSTLPETRRLLSRCIPPHSLTTCPFVMWKGEQNTWAWRMCSVEPSGSVSKSSFVECTSNDSEFSRHINTIEVQARIVADYHGRLATLRHVSSIQLETCWIQVFWPNKTSAAVSLAFTFPRLEQ